MTTIGHRRCSQNRCPGVFECVACANINLHRAVDMKDYSGTVFWLGREHSGIFLSFFQKSHNDVHMIRILLDYIVSAGHGYLINDFVDGGTILHAVALSHSYEAVEAVLTYFPHLLRVPDERGALPLYVSAQSLRIEPCKAMLSAGATLRDWTITSGLPLDVLFVSISKLQPRLARAQMAIQTVRLFFRTHLCHRIDRNVGEMICRWIWAERFSKKWDIHR